MVKKLEASDIVGETKLNTLGKKMVIIGCRKSSDIDVLFPETGYIKYNTTYSNFKKGSIKDKTPKQKINKYESRVGESNINNQGIKMTIIEYHNADECVIEFETGTIRTAQYQKFKNGQVLDYNSPRKYKRKNFNYYIIGKYTILYVCDYEFIIDTEDLNKIKNGSLTVSSRNNGDAYCVYKDDYIEVNLHRYIMDCFDDNLIVDHKDGNSFNNSKSNLRIGTQSQNLMNKATYKNNTSGHKGVIWYEPTKKWKAEITKDGITYRLGYFYNKEDAINARIKAEKKIFGEWSRDYGDE